jgi:transposase
MTQKLYCGIDLHSNNHYVSIIDQKDKRLKEKRLSNDLSKTLSLLEPYQNDLQGIAIESTFNWYWLVDGLMDAGFPVSLVNTSAVKQYEGLKHTDDQHDAFWLAHLMRLKILPTGYIYPKAQRSLRDLLRKRMQLVQCRTSHVISAQAQVWRSTGKRLKSQDIKKCPDNLLPDIADDNLLLSIQSNLKVIQLLNQQIETIEATILPQCKNLPAHK